MENLSEFLASDHRRTLEFFVLELFDEAPSTVPEDELLYTASVLAHYAQTPAPPANLTEIVNKYLIMSAVSVNPTAMEVAGSECLLLAGFFRDHLKPQWQDARKYESASCHFFSLASKHEPKVRKSHLMWRLAGHVPILAETSANASRTLQKEMSFFNFNLPPPSP